MLKWTEWFTIHWAGLPVHRQSLV